MSSTSGTKDGLIFKGDKAFGIFSRSMPSACNALLVSIEKELPVTELWVDYLRSDVSLLLGRFLQTDCVHGMLEGKDSQVLIWGFHLFVDNSIGCSENSELVKVNSLYFGLAVEILARSWCI